MTLRRRVVPLSCALGLIGACVFTPEDDDRPALLTFGHDSGSSSDTASFIVDDEAGSDDTSRDDDGEDEGVDADSGVSHDDAGEGDEVSSSSSSDDTEAEPTGDMTFFVTSVGTGEQGGALGGLAGADARCQELAEAVGAGDRTWQAYLSTAPIEGLPGDLVHARDRIGAGPWFNALGLLVAEDVEDLHDGPIPEDRLLTELGAGPPAEEHDILTGTGSDGFALTAFPDNPDAPAPTCGNWTRNDFNGWTWVGHFDAGGPDTWNSAHGTSCDPAGLASTAGSGRTYCFAID